MYILKSLLLSLTVSAVQTLTSDGFNDSVSSFNSMEAVCSDFTIFHENFGLSNDCTMEI